MAFIEPDRTGTTLSLVPQSANGDGAPSHLTRESAAADRVAWQARLAGWRDDTARWQAEHDALLVRLADMQRAVVEHGRSLAAHESLFPGVDLALAEFGAVVAALPAAPPPDALASVAHRHGDLAALVHRCDDAHGRMARHHAEVLARMGDLERAAAAPL
jgi:hypothetical protein